MWDCGACGSAYTPYIYGEYMYQFIYTLSLIIQCISKIIPTPPQTLETLINKGIFTIVGGSICESIVGFFDYYYHTYQDNDKI